MENGNVKNKESAQQCIASITLPFDPLEFPRETPRHYICATEEELKEMLSEIGLGDLSQLFVHIDPNILFLIHFPLSEEKDYHEVAKKSLKFPNFQIIKFPSLVINYQFGKLPRLLSLYPILETYQLPTPLST